MSNLYLTNRFFLFFGAVIVLFVISFPLDFLFPVAQTVLVLAILITGGDFLRLFSKKISVTAQRILPKRFSLSDPNLVKIQIVNSSTLALSINIIDELPFQFQKRDFARTILLSGEREETIQYNLTPLERGNYEFGHLNLFLTTSWNLVERRQIIVTEDSVPVYPSILQMKQLELRAFDKISNLTGIKKIRRIGHSYEFEQIKNYVRGDDYRSINWKATSRQGKLMVNQYEDEKAQQIYCMIDKSRVMKMPFNGLSLLDYAINTSLVISNVALKKYDRAGLLTFSDKIGTVVKAERNASQINKILQALYREQERHLEANYELLYQASRRVVKGRSLVFLFTNFESLFAAERVLPILRKINNLHLLVVVFFENTEIIEYSEKEVTNVEEIYFQTIAQKFVSEKQQIVQKLRQYGIQAILTSPDELSINTINKYLELKSRGLI